ncbi:GEVED domain-containing protein [Flavobacterium sp.]|uniref:GEVED domain-containing protein n=1 Tax=Flavobacterium sp. TaxID=239 RepID=UPI003D6AC1A6
MKIKLLIFSLLFSGLSWGQFNIAAGSTNYTQNFNALTSGTWADNTTVTGWYANTSSGTGTTITAYGAGTGTTTAAGLYAFGVAGINALSDRGLGYYASNAFTGGSGTGKGYIGWRLKNTTGSAISSITVTWTGEQWRRDNASAQTLSLFYQTGATVVSLTTGSWTAAPSTFTSPQLSATALALDGNATANRVAGISVVIAVSIPVGEEIMLRWEDLNDSGNDHSMAIDDVTVNAALSAGCTGPSTQASAIGTSNSTLNGFDINWTSGNGNGTIVVIRDNSLVNALPVSGTTYTASLDWATAGQIDVNNRVIFRGSGTSAAPITGLNPGTEYRVTAYEYNTTGDCYNLASPTSTVAYTMSAEPTAHAASFTCTTISSSQIDLNFSAANTITNGKAYLILSKIGSVPTGLPTDGVFYTAGTTIGDATVMGYTSLAGTDTTFSATGLSSNTNYYFVLIPLNSYISVAQTMNYRTSATIPSSNCTTPTAPCVSEDFVSFADWANNGTALDAVATHYGAASPCRALGSGDDLISPAVNNPVSLQFHQDNSNPGTATIDYKIGAGVWVSCYSFATNNAGANETVDLTNVAGVNLSLQNNVTFRFNSSFNTWYLDDVVITCGPPSAACTTPAAQPTALNFSSVTQAGFNGSFTAASPVPSGYLVVYSTSSILAVGDLPVNGVTYAAGNTLGDGTVAYVGTSTSFSVSGLSSGIPYYTFVFSYNSGSCVTAYNTTSPLLGNVTTSLSYCTSNGNTTYQTSITNVTLNTINNTSAKPSGYSDYTGISTDLEQGASYPMSARINTDGNFTVLAFVWIDFNHDFDFNDAGEAFDLGSATNVSNGLSSSSPLTINVPLSATTGPTSMRVIVTYDGDSSPCLTGFDGEVEDYTINITSSCTPTHTVTGFVPVSGPTATEVTLIGTDFSAGTTVGFNGINATVVFVDSNTLIATVPTGSTTGSITVTEGGCKVVSGNFTQIQKTGTCSNGNNLTDLIISEVYDSLVGNSWYMELYNPTSNPINLDAVGADYKLIRYGDIGTTNGIRTVDISGIIAPGGTYLADLGSDSSCGAMAFNFTDKANGINENDEIQLIKNNVIVDRVHCPNEKGYSIIRNLAAAGPSAVFNAADWTTNLNESCANLGMVPFTSSNNTPTVNTNPTDVTACGSTANLTVTATAGSGGGLTYQWFYNNGIATEWTAVTTLPGLIITGQTSNALSLNGTVGSYGGYQFYCQVTEGGTCSIASDAAQLNVISTIWNGTGWSNGTPSVGKLTIINGNYNTTTHGDIDACSLIVNTGFTATVTANHYINIENDLTVNGTLDVLDDGSLVQVNDAGINTGNIFMKRVATIRLLDYVYWSSPVAGFAVANVSPGTSFSKIWKWNSSVVNPNGGFGNWQNANENMSIGKGYIIRAPNGFNATPQAMTANFIGVPNNGVISASIERGNFTGVDYSGTNGVVITKNDDNWNLIGNPYPSAISAVDFLALNANIEGSVRVWTHGTLPSNAATNPFYGSYAYNYSASDYIVYNATGPSTQNGFDGYIGAGQSFFVLMNDGPATTENVTFQNTLRNTGHRNDQFYRNAGQQNTANSIERHRIWVDLVSATGNVNRALVGYIEGATQNKDRLYDAYSDRKNTQDFYSIVNDEPLVIQGRALPFNADDTVPMGVKLPTNGTYTIAVASVDGLFSGNAQTIYLEDKALNVIHNLSNAPYQFTANQGVMNNRFVLRYTNATLSNPDFESAENSIVINTLNNDIKINSSLKNIKGLTVYNVLGQSLAAKKNVNAAQAVVNSIVRSNQALIVKITLENGQTITRKIVF